MIMTPVSRPAAATLPDLGKLEDASADLDTSRVFADAAFMLLGEMRTWARSQTGPMAEIMVGRINDCETLVCEARCKAIAAREAVNAFSDAEHAARASREVRHGE